METNYPHEWIEPDEDGVVVAYCLNCESTAEGSLDPRCPELMQRALNHKETRRRLPSRRRGYTQKVKIGGEKVFIRVSEFDDGTPGEIFVNMFKEGAGFSGMLNAFCIAISVGLQYGVPLDKFVDLFMHFRFQPEGVVFGREGIDRCASPVDLIFQELALTYLGDDAVVSRPVLNPIDSE